ncbi:hypothetical protein [Nitrosopumilus sp.]|uniref:hypothetical protein n=1 Tax=Nitrosopumilus sp. TaxID=2024843 RepID=UPI0034A0931C
MKIKIKEEDLEKIQDKKKHQEAKKHELCVMISKFENSMLRIQQHVKDYQNKDIACKDLEVSSIFGIVDHQLGHIQRFRNLVNE